LHRAAGPGNNLALPSIALAIPDVGLALPLQEALEAAGHRVTWRADLSPEVATESLTRFDAVVLAEAASLEAAATAWRDLDPPAAVLALGSASDRAVADAAHVTLVPSQAPPAEVMAAIDRALSLRFTGRLSLSFARGALGLPSKGDDMADAAAVIAGARNGDLALVGEAMRWYPNSYVTATAKVAELREVRALEVPEIELCGLLDGSRTARTVVAGKAREAPAAMRALWALCSVGAASLSHEPPDAATARRRAVLEARRHLVARRLRLGRTSFYDVLEVSRTCTTADIERAVAALAKRYAPAVLAAVDVGDLTPQVAPLWQQIERARAVLSDANTRALYDHKLSTAEPPVTAAWWQGPYDSSEAEIHFARGQKALVDGDAFKAVSEFAAAARTHPEHPDYEASLSWARHRADLTRGRDKLASAKQERAAAEAALYGRRPWPRAMVALALLCAASEDPGAARWHLQETLAVEPAHPIAKQLLLRLGA
jgi:hypothetical protein